MRTSVLGAVALLASVSIASVLPRDYPTTASGPSNIFSFGDSYTSTNFDINGAQPSASDPDGNMDLGDHNTTALGPVWVQYLATTFNSTPTLLYNFAVGGASIPDNYTYQLHYLYEPKYSSQLSTLWTSSNSLFTSFIGTNDVTDAWLPSNQTIITYRSGLYADRLEEMYTTGARNFFIVNVPPLYRSPFIMGYDQPSIDRYRDYGNFLNGNITALVNTFKSAHSDAQIQLYDLHTFFSSVLDSPTTYGFTDNTCQDSPGCLWSGNFHILSAFHKVIANDMTVQFNSFTYS